MAGMARPAGERMRRLVAPPGVYARVTVSIICGEVRYGIGAVSRRNCVVIFIRS